MNALGPLQVMRQGAAACAAGTSMASDQAPEGFAFCPYDAGTPEHACWVSGYAQQWLAANGVRT